MQPEPDFNLLSHDKNACENSFAWRRICVRYGKLPSRPPLIDAYMARRALDYLVGCTLSPVLWRKLPGSRSAGRVQSVALRLI